MTEINMSAYGLVNQYAAMAQEIDDRYSVGRILSQEKGIYRVVSEKGEQFAEVSGKLRYNAGSISDFPAVGDFVKIDRCDIQSHTIIHQILPRKSVFIRKAAGTTHNEQIVASNIDTLFVCMSLNNDFNLRRLERYLSVAWDSGAKPIIVLTKSDLCTELDSYVSAVEGIAVGTDVIVTSSKDKDGYKELLPYIGEGKTIALIGSSGVGKSTLINRLIGEDILETNQLRNDDKGRHTTTRRQLFLLENGGMVIDTPGMRELGLLDNSQGLEKSFSDIEELASSCRFGDCSHTSEPGCAIIEAISKGTLSKERFMSYQKLKNETQYAENSEGYLAKKKEKFKNIAKLNKSINKRK